MTPAIWSSGLSKPSRGVDVIVGIQWGDEGKGRIVDLYAQDYDVIARFGGGDNAGHSIVVGNTELALRIVPSGALVPHAELFVGSGTVVNPATLVQELDRLADLGVDISRLKVSDRAHVVLERHAVADRAAEEARGAGAIGTTGRGIGPAYVDKVARAGTLMRDYVRHDDPLARRLAGHVVDGVAFIADRIRAGKRILAEGAQGTLLDVGFGTYPYVTSSHTIAGAACIGLGIGPTAIGRVIGVVKAYCTRVGAGPFPTELHDERGERLRRQGDEFGTVTGRPRRCGWFDAVAGAYAADLNGLTEAVVTKLDVLSGFERLSIGTHYAVDGDAAGFGEASDSRLQVRYEEVAGWSEPIDACRRFEELPAAARTYVGRIGDALGVPVALVSVGRERSQLARP
ncbi:MAG TPA: adenylosuccinate synthetase [Candidatus Tumulicola sp.]